MQNVTLIINVAITDLDYVEQNLRHLCKSHNDIQRRIVILDNAKFKTAIDNHVNKELEILISLAEKLKNENVITEIIYSNNFNSKNKLYKKYLGGIINENEAYDYRGAPILAYVIGFEITHTKYLLHYDADMLTYAAEQKWVKYAISKMENNAKFLCASPATHPVIEQFEKEDAEFCWFSTRCSLINLSVFKQIRHNYPIMFRIELILRKLLKKSYPSAFESLVSILMVQQNLTTIYVKSNPAYIIHPEIKNKKYLRLLPRIIESIEINQIPPLQIGKENIDVEAWKNYLN
ncbi:hypothetical protein [Pedobacter sp. Leaf132]|uniref:hypothetical protein n=1 Tax=Pedobacter sp. Leaf132 TaxID=2876557 RepID=UPI001E2BD97C|nr:hypothetical protein [Pedobacter sp. Leaf132]